ILERFLVGRGVMQVSIPSGFQSFVALAAVLNAHLITSLTVDSIRKNLLVAIFAVGCFVTTSMLGPDTASAQVDPRVAKSMETLRTLTAKLGQAESRRKRPRRRKRCSWSVFRHDKGQQQL